MNDHATEDYFQPHAEPASLFGNDVGHLAEEPVRLPAHKIGAEAAFAAVEDTWPAWAARVAGEHADRDPACMCGACRLTRNHR